MGLLLLETLSHTGFSAGKLVLASQQLIGEVSPCIIWVQPVPDPVKIVDRRRRADRVVQGAV